MNISKYLFFKNFYCLNLVLDEKNIPDPFVHCHVITVVSENILKIINQAVKYN